MVKEKISSKFDVQLDKKLVSRVSRSLVTISTLGRLEDF